MRAGEVTTGALYSYRVPIIRSVEAYLGMLELCEHVRVQAPNAITAALRARWVTGAEVALTPERLGEVEHDPLAKAVRLAGGPAAVGRLYTPPISSQAVSQWERCPAERVRALAAATGGQVTEAELRPDIYGAAIAAQVPA